LGALLLAVLALCLVLAAISPAGNGFAIRIFVLGLILFGFGWTVLRLLLGRAALRAETSLLAFSTGLVVLGGIAQVANNLGWGVTYWLLPLAAILAVPGCVGAWLTVRSHFRESVAHGWLYFVVIAAIWMLYYLPASQLDIVPTQDGGVKWWYADSFFHQAVTQELANSLAWKELPPRTPGFCRIPLCYQYGSHAVAAQAAYWLGLSVDDAAARGVTWIGLLALTGVTIGAGRRMAIQQRRQPLAGLLALSLVFLLPGLQTIYANNSDTSFRHPLILISPRWESIAASVWDISAGLSGGSPVWTCIIAFTVLALLAEDGAENQAGRRSFAVLVLATAGIGLNCVGALCCFGVGACHGLLYGYRRWPTYVLLPAMAAGFVLWFRLSGFDFNSGHYMTMKTADIPDAYGRVYAVVRNFSLLAANGAFLLLGLRALAVLSLAWSRAGIKVALLIFVIVYSGVFLAVQLLNYPILYLGMILSVFAAGPAAEILADLGTGTAAATRLWMSTQLVYRKYAAGVCLATAAALVPTLFTIIRRRSVHGLPGFSKCLIVGLVLVSVAYALLRFLESSSWRPSRAQVLLFAGLFSAVSFLGALRGVVTLAADWGESAIVLDAGRTQSLRYVSHELPVDAVLTTSHHEAPTREVRERSLMYSAVSGRRILLEGWRYMTAQGSPEFPGICTDNDALFGTNDQREARRIVRKYGITHILLEPGQSLGFAVADATWLKQVGAPGSMCILQALESN
jgi:hypothetical protein